MLPVPFLPLMSNHADEKVAAEDPAAARGPETTTTPEGKPMTELERIRHSAAHILATAILRLCDSKGRRTGDAVRSGGGIERIRILAKCICRRHLCREDFDQGVDFDAKKL